MLASRATVPLLARAVFALGALVLSLQGCGLTADLEPLQGGDSALGCADDEKVCHDEQNGRGFCVALDVARYGCGNPNCRPCKLVGVETARCLDNECVLFTCKDGWEDCDLDGRECEVDTRDSITNCGACGRVCDQTHSFNSCVDSVCVLSGCSRGWADCDGDHVNGCEAFTGSTGDETNPCSM